MTSRPRTFQCRPAKTGGAVNRGLRARFGRVFERMVRGFLWLWLFAAAGVVISFVMPPRDHLRAADWQLDAGPVQGYEVGQPKMILDGPEPVWVIRRESGAFTALAAVCQYQHCVLRWNPVRGLFSCPCHRGSYDLDGVVTSGPSRKALRSFFVNIKAERVRVHLLRSPDEES